MKKLKKFAALLLVGVMALALLTACGGGQTEEQKVMAKISQEKGVHATNDAPLRAVAGYFTAFNFHSEKVGNDRGITITARYDYKDTFLNKVLKEISEYVDTAHNASVKQDGDWTNIGVVVQSNNEQSYIGISIRIKSRK